MPLTRETQQVIHGLSSRDLNKSHSFAGFAHLCVRIRHEAPENPVAHYLPNEAKDFVDSLILGHLANRNKYRNEHGAVKTLLRGPWQLRPHSILADFGEYALKRALLECLRDHAGVCSYDEARDALLAAKQQRIDLAEGRAPPDPGWKKQDIKAAELSLMEQRNITRRVRGKRSLDSPPPSDTRESSSSVAARERSVERARGEPPNKRPRPLMDSDMYEDFRRVDTQGPASDDDVTDMESSHGHDGAESLNSIGAGGPDSNRALPAEDAPALSVQDEEDITMPGIERDSEATSHNVQIPRALPSPHYTSTPSEPELLAAYATCPSEQIRSQEAMNYETALRRRHSEHLVENPPHNTPAICPEERVSNETSNQAPSADFASHSTKQTFVQVIDIKETATVKGSVELTESSQPLLFGSCTKEALQSLNSSTWVNDAALNIIFELLKIEGGRHQILGSYDVDCMEPTRNATRKRRTFPETCEMILIPLYVAESHWVLAVIDPRSHKASLYDPLYDPRYMEAACEGLRVFCRTVIRDGDWIFDQGIDILRQHDGHNCGVYVIVAAMYAIVHLKRPKTIACESWRRLLMAAIAGASDSPDRPATLCITDHSLEVPLSACVNSGFWKEKLRKLSHTLEDALRHETTLYEMQRLLDAFPSIQPAQDETVTSSTNFVEQLRALAAAAGVTATPRHGINVQAFQESVEAEDKKRQQRYKGLQAMREQLSLDIKYYVAAREMAVAEKARMKSEALSWIERERQEIENC